MRSPAPERLRLHPDPAGVQEIQWLLPSFHQVPEAVQKELLRDLDGLVARLSDCRLCTASAAGDGVLLLQLPPGWVSELRALAMRANQANGMCGHGGPHAK